MLGKPDGNSRPRIELPSELGESGLLAIRKRFFKHYDSISTEELLTEYDERVLIFEEFGFYGEALVLREGRRMWEKNRGIMNEAQFREEMLMTLALAFHATFVIRPPVHATSKHVDDLRRRIAERSDSALETT